MNRKSDVHTTFGAALLERRRRLGLTQGQLADAVDSYQTKISTLEKMAEPPRDPALIERLAQALHGTYEHIVAGYIPADFPLSMDKPGAEAIVINSSFRGDIPNLVTYIEGLSIPDVVDTIGEWRELPPNEQEIIADLIHVRASRARTRKQQEANKGA